MSADIQRGAEKELSIEASPYKEVFTAYLNGTMKADQADFLASFWPELLPGLSEGMQIKMSSTRAEEDSEAEDNWETVCMKGLAADGGLFMPTRLPDLDPKAIEAMRGLSYQEIAFLLYRSFIPVEDIDNDTLRSMVDGAYDFEPVLEPLNFDPSISIGRLDRGPTASFKDFAAQFMGQMLSHICEKQEREADIVVATSGDTGVAIAAAFANKPNINVTIFYPTDGVSPVQEKQMLAYNEYSNIQVIPIDGTFDDCQRLAKEIQRRRKSGDERLQNITSANSINLWRLIPQMAHFFHLHSRLPKEKNGSVPEPVVSIPSGNAGHLMACVFAREMGLPISRIVVGTNKNNILANVISKGILSGDYAFAKTSSNSMDIQVPSNLERLLQFYHDHYGKGEQLQLTEMMTEVKNRSTLMWLRAECEQWLAAPERRYKNPEDANIAQVGPAQVDAFLASEKIELAMADKTAFWPDSSMLACWFRQFPKSKHLSDFGFSPEALEQMQEDIWTADFPDEEANSDRIQEIYDASGEQQVLEPHGIIALMAAQRYRRDFVEDRKTPVITLETMHPGKSNIYERINAGRNRPVTFSNHIELAALETKTFAKPPAQSCDPDLIIGMVHEHAQRRRQRRDQVKEVREDVGEAFEV